jgi:putative ABC transport system permease protein
VNRLQHVLRRLARAPMFTGVTLLTLAIGIGANTAVFSVVESVLLKPLPYPKPEELVGIWHTAPGIGIKEVNVAPSLYFSYREENRVFQEVGLWDSGTASVTGLAEPEQVRSLMVSDGLLPLLRIPPVLGRWFSREDDSPGTQETVILTYGYWQQRFAGDPKVIGRMLQVDSRPRQIVGVMPAHFRFLDLKAAILLPQRMDRSKVYVGNFSYQAIARMKPGVSLAQANADVNRMIPLMYRFPMPPGFSRKLFEDARLAAALRPLKRDVVGDIGGVLWVLMGTIGIVLLIACANVANLVLVRAEGRQQELAVRAALGAGWGQIAAELLFESVGLALAGGVLGLGLAWAALRGLVAMGPANLPRLEEISIDPWVMLFTVAISLISGLLFGLIPVFKYAGPRSAAALRQGGRTLSHSRERHRARAILVIVQVALALVLLISSGLMIRTFQSMRQVHPGFTHPEQVQALRISIPGALVKEPEEVARIEDQMAKKLAAIPGVKSVGFASGITMEGYRSFDPIVAEDHPTLEGKMPPMRRFKFASPGFLATVGNPVIAGRDFTWTDVYNKLPVAIVTENMAREVWGSADAALGKRIRENPKEIWREVVGVTGEERDEGVEHPAPTTVYWPPMMKNFWGNDIYVQRGVSYAIRSSRAGTDSFRKEVQQAVWSVNSSLPLADVRTLDEIYRKSMARTSFMLVMLAIAGGMALLLGLVGIYGVISYAVSQRTREIGIRMALGARQLELTGMFVRHGLLLAAIGVVGGLGVAVGLTRLMKSILFDVRPVDPLTYFAVSAVLFAAAALASFVPSLRASRIDPVEALRAE